MLYLTTYPFIRFRTVEERKTSSPILPTKTNTTSLASPNRDPARESWSRLIGSGFVPQEKLGPRCTPYFFFSIIIKVLRKFKHSRNCFATLIKILKEMIDFLQIYILNHSEFLIRLMAIFIHTILFNCL